ncbi:ankyrin repeat and SOCS box protein 8-like [Mya arenaria]|uniref:ankyrin repeat and SOCS box protein 8-like n=1 Tax=Mya arenaria TaxID=6604 RepID=UPI0022DFE2CB|nr:ankyrin repeat and SOCS box protein 8-like [Mya arenaria]
MLGDTDWLHALCRCIRQGDAIKVQNLLEGRSVPGHSGSELKLAENPLHLAVVQGNRDIVELLLSRGANIEATNVYGESPLHIAARSGDTALVSSLLAAGSNIDSYDCGEATPLFHAVYSDKPSTTELLVKAGANLNTLNEELMTPLDHAVLYKYSRIISLLLRGGCSVETSNGSEYFPGHYSNSLLFSLWTNGDLDNVQVLIDAGYKVRRSDLTKLFAVAKQLNWDSAMLNCVDEMVSQPLTLKGSCRVAIRRHLMSLRDIKQKQLLHLVEDLPLPSILKDYVSMFKF